MKRGALVTNTINKPGGAEYLTIAMFKALTFPNSSELDVQILGREPLNLRVLSLWVEESVIDELKKHYRIMSRFPHNISTLMKYNIVINTRSNEILEPACIHYLHWIFSPWDVKDSETLAYYRKAYSITKSRFSLHIKTPGTLSTN
jgi:hypothetical protein